MKGTVLEGAHPMQLVGRMVLISHLKEIGARKISMLKEEERADFIKDEFTGADEKTGELYGEKVVNYEFALFEATDEQFEKLLDNFIKRAEPTEEQKQFITEV